MAFKPRPPTSGEEAEGEKYVSVVTSSQFAEFGIRDPHANNGINGDHGGEEEVEGMEGDESFAGYEDSEAEMPARGRGGAGLALKLNSAKSAIKNFKMPSPQEMKDNFVNSNFSKSFHQPLLVKARVERSEVQQARQALTQEKNPAELSQIHGLSDFPVPRMAGGAKEAADTAEVDSKTAGSSSWNIQSFAAIGTIPRSLKEQQLVTGMKETAADDEEINRRMELTKTMTPKQLGEINSLADFPVPSKIKNMFERSSRKPADAEEANSKKKKEVVGEEEEEEEHNPGGLYGTLPRSLRETKLVTAVKVEEDAAVLASRKNLVASKTPAELSAIHGLSDLPIPSRLERLVKRSVSTPGGLETTSIVSSKEPFKFGVPEAFKMELAVKSKVETNLEQLEVRKQLVRDKSPRELSNINSLADLPIPTPVSNLLKGIRGPASSRRPSRASQTTGSAALREKRKRNLTIGGIFSSETSPFVPESMRETKLVVRSKVEADQEVLASRQLAVKTSSPAELSAINCIEDLPIPSKLKNLTLRRNASANPDGRAENNESSQPARAASALGLSSNNNNRDMLYNSLPRSLRDQQLVVRTKTEEDPEELKRRQELTRTQTPSQLSQMSGLSDLPLPTKIESMIRTVSPTGNEDSPAVPPRQKWKKEDIYESIPSSLRSELIVRSREMVDEDELKERQEIIRTHTPSQLSEIHSLSDLPLPKFIEKRLQKTEKEPAEERVVEKANKEDEPFSIYGTLPASLKTNLMVKTVQEEPHIQMERAETVKSKSVHELSQIHGLSDLPVPGTLRNLVKRGYAPVERKKKFKDQMAQGKSSSTQSLSQSLYNTLPRSLSDKQLLVRARLEDPEVLASRREVVSSKSVSELSQVQSLHDFPVPTPLSKFFHKSMEKIDSWTKREHNPENQKAFSTTDLNGLSSRPVSRGARSIRSDVYSTLPRSLTDQLVVRTKVETDENILRERQALVESKSPAELSQIHNMDDLPIPTRIQAWLQHLDTLKSTEALAQSNGMPDHPKKFTETIYRTLPSSLSQPCIVRSKVEDPTRLIERQQLQQTKSIHELSKIRNMNEIPVPGDLFKLPDVPLPTMKDLLNTIARTPKRNKPKPKAAAATNGDASASESLDTDFKMNPSDMNKLYSEIADDASAEGMNGTIGHDAEYEVVMKPHVVEEQSPEPQALEEEFDTFGLANQIKGTPERNTRNKKKTSNRRSRDTDEESRHTASDAGDEKPPPLPPKRMTPSPKKGMSVESQGSMEAEDYPIKPIKGSLQLKVGIQSMPLPAPPAPPRTLKKKSESFDEEDDVTYNTYTENFKTAADTLNSKTLVEISSITQKVESDDVTLADSIVDSMQSCAETLVSENETIAEGGDFCSDDDNPYPSVYFEADKKAGGSLKRSGRRLEEGTQQLSMELMEHVESLRSTLDNMSSRLGTRSRSRSASRSRSRPRKDQL